jgi:hypothetical protein
LWLEQCVPVWFLPWRLGEQTAILLPGCWMTWALPSNVPRTRLDPPFRTSVRARPHNSTVFIENLSRLFSNWPVLYNTPTVFRCHTTESNS